MTYILKHSLNFLFKFIFFIIFAESKFYFELIFVKFRQTFLIFFF